MVGLAGGDEARGTVYRAGVAILSVATGGSATSPFFERGGVISSYPVFMRSLNAYLI